MAARTAAVDRCRAGSPSASPSSVPPEWPRYTPEQDQLMELGVAPRVLTNYRKAQLDAQENAMQDVIDDTRKSIEDFVRSLANER